MGLFNNSKNFPSLPQILLRLIKACNDDSVSLEALSTLISKDPSLCTRVVRLVNSPFVGLSHKVNTVNQAVVYLGLNTIKNLAISASVLQAFKRSEYCAIFALNQFWFHSFTCAVAARNIAKRTAYHSAEEAFLAGLLHDIGKLILVMNYSDTFSDVTDLPVSPSSYDRKIEYRVGFSHEEVGAYIIRSWHLNDVMADAVLYHHQALTEIQETFPLVKIVFAANAFFHSSEHPSENQGIDAGRSLFGFTRTESEDIIMAARQEAIDVAASFEIDTMPYEERSSETSTGTKNIRKTLLYSSLPPR